MDPGWPSNPTNSLICVLCKAALPYHDSNPERFFRHLLADHCCFYNLNLMLEVSLAQPVFNKPGCGVAAAGSEPRSSAGVDSTPVWSEQQSTAEIFQKIEAGQAGETLQLQLSDLNRLLTPGGSGQLDQSLLHGWEQKVNQATSIKIESPVVLNPPGVENPNRHLVPDDLQLLIIQQNPERKIKFTFSQRLNTQMVVDDFILKKKKGPYLTKGGRSVNWKCTSDSCQYTAVSWEGGIQDGVKKHNHPAQPELYIKKQARVKIRESMTVQVQESATEERPVTNLVMDLVTETRPEQRDMIGSVDALKQAARRYNRKLQRRALAPPNQLQPAAAIVPISNLSNYEVVEEFPADYQFMLETDSELAGLQLELPVLNFLNSNHEQQQVTVEEAVDHPKPMEMSIEAVPGSEFKRRDDLEELLEASPIKDDVRDELSCDMTTK